MQSKGRRSVGSNIYFERISNFVGLLDESIGKGKPRQNVDLAVYNPVIGQSSDKGYYRNFVRLVDEV